jgi:hypothetical protein
MPSRVSKPRGRRAFLVAALLAAFLAALLFGASAFAAPSAELWPRWAKHDAASTRKVDHDAWNKWLAAHVVAGKGVSQGINLVRYQKVSAANKAALDTYLKRMGAVPISTYSRAEQKAYWINVYNALTVDLMVDRWPVETIRDVDISPGLFADGPWGKKLFSVEGVKISLNDIEHRILRPVFRDPRVHYAINCASLGCPNLRPTAYRRAGLDAALQAAAVAFVNHPRGARVDQGRLYVSSIYDWFESDFGGSERGVIEHLRKFAKPALKKQLSGVTEIEDDQYDWRINAAP